VNRSAVWQHRENVIPTVRRHQGGTKPLSNGTSEAILHLQRVAGNQAVTELLDRKGQGPIADDDVINDARHPSGVSSPAETMLQRKVGDGHDLTSARFAGNLTLEAVFDNERLLTKGSKGAAVTKVQQALMDYGLRMPKFGADGTFGGETRAAVKSFQADTGITGKDLDGVIGPVTMGELDTRAATFSGPGSTVGAGGAAAAAAPTGVSVTVPARIRAASTPGSMAQDRIPPSVDTPVSVAVAGFAGGTPVRLSVAGASAANGTVTIDGAATKDVVGSTTVNLRGATQTSPGSAGKLQLVASQGGTEIERSGAFSVSAVPQFYTDAFDHDLTGARRGFVVQDGWESDSGSIADLDQADISEQVEVTTQTGCFAGLAGNVSSYLPANSLTQDTHSTPTATLTSAGRRIAQQTCEFRDKRTGANDIPMRDSGYLLDRQCIKVGPGFRFIIKKIGTATTANGVPSGAGAGSITRNQVV
jgi:peptidoglycan hydrolase-like protein with peptidoglycan-binding domain